MTAKIIPFHRCACCGAKKGRVKLHNKDQPDIILSRTCFQCDQQIRRVIKRARPVARVLHRIGLSHDQITDVMMNVYEILEAEYDTRGEDKSAS
jgi:hypothetical protein